MTIMLPGRHLFFVSLAFVAVVSTAGVCAQLSLLPGDTALAPAAGDQTAPAIALGGNTFLAVWADNRANPSGVYAWSEYETSRDIYGGWTR